MPLSRSEKKRKQSQNRSSAYRNSSKSDSYPINNDLVSSPGHDEYSPEKATVDMASLASRSNSPDPDDADSWTVVNRRKKLRKDSSSSRRGRTGPSAYPKIHHSPSLRLHTQIKIDDFQSLVLYVLADGAAPNWIAVRNAKQIRKFVVLMIPGLEQGMFNGSIPLVEPSSLKQTRDELAPALETNDMLSAQTRENANHLGTTSRDVEKVSDTQRLKLPSRKPTSPDDYYPIALESKDLAPVLQPLSAIYTHLWPVKAPGDDKISRIHSPMQAILTVPIAKKQLYRQERNSHRYQNGSSSTAESHNWKDDPTMVTNFVASLSDLQDDDYVIHPSMLETDADLEYNNKKRKHNHQTAADGWVDSKAKASQLPKSNKVSPSKSEIFDSVEVLAVDCEMCVTSDGASSLTRVSILNSAGNIILDELVKPSLPITDYLTAYSGITAEKLQGVTTTLPDIQSRLLDLFTDNTILIGHSLVSDLNALKMTHPNIIDTSMLYPHPRGPPFKSSLKFLAQRHLHREIQKTSDANGHDPTQDALAALDLVRQKCERGPEWGTSEANGESIFKRLARSPRPSANGPGNPSDGNISACVDWGIPSKGYGGNADICIGCQSDQDVQEGVIKAVNGDETGAEIPGGGVDFVWGRMRELELTRGFNDRPVSILNRNEKDSATQATHPNRAEDPSPETLSSAVASTVKRIQAIYDALPRCTAFAIYSGTSDPREYARLQAKRKRFKAEFKIKKWDELGDLQWTDDDDQALRAECRKARNGIGFVCVK